MPVPADHPNANLFNLLDAMLRVNASPLELTTALDEENDPQDPRLTLFVTTLVRLSAHRLQEEAKDSLDKPYTYKEKRALAHTQPETIFTHEPGNHAAVTEVIQQLTRDAITLKRPLGAPNAYLKARLLSIIPREEPTIIVCFEKASIYKIDGIRRANTDFTVAIHNHHDSISLSGLKTELETELHHKGDPQEHLQISIDLGSAKDELVDSILFHGQPCPPIFALDGCITVGLKNTVRTTDTIKQRMRELLPLRTIGNYSLISG